MTPHADQRRLSTRQRGEPEDHTLWDCLFHSATYIFVAAGLVILWRASRRAHGRWSWKLLPATMLIGFGLFNVVEGLVNHRILGTTSTKRCRASNGSIGMWPSSCGGAAMLVGGWVWLRRGRHNPVD